MPSWIIYTDRSVEWKFQQNLSLNNNVRLDGKSVTSILRSCYRQADKKLTLKNKVHVSIFRYCNVSNYNRSWKVSSSFWALKFRNMYTVHWIFYMKYIFERSRSTSVSINLVQIWKREEVIWLQLGNFNWCIAWDLKSIR